MLKPQNTLLLAFCVLLTASSVRADWATLKGQFLYGNDDAKLPAPKKIRPDKDVEACGKHELFDESLVINSHNRGIANVLIWAYKPKAIHGGYKATENATIKIDNAGCRFKPHAVAVRSSQTFQVGNSDPVSHNALIHFLKNGSMNPIIPPGGSVEKEFSKTETFPLKLQCSIHNWMQAIVLVQDHPYMAITDEDGKFELKDLPAGKVTLKLWHERKGYIKTMTVDTKAAVVKKGRFQIELRPGETATHRFVLQPKAF